MNADDAKRPLPPGWRWARLGEVCQPDRRPVAPGSEEALERPYVALENVESESGAILPNGSEGRPQDILSVTFGFDPRHVLYGKLRPYLNKVALPDFTGRCATELVPLLPKPGCDRHFLAWLLRSPGTVDWAMRFKTGTKMPRADLDDLFRLLVPVPLLDEQRRIAARLSEQMAVVDRMRRAALAQLEAARALPASFVRQVFESEEANTWPRRELGNVCTILMGQSPDGRSYNRDGLGTPLLNGPTEFGDEFPTPAQWTSRPTKVCQRGDILLCVRGATTGRVNIADRSYCVGRGVAALRGIPGTLANDYLYYHLEHETPSLLRETAGSTFANLPGERLRKLAFAIPPVWSQNRVAAVLRGQMTKGKELREMAEAQLEAVSALPGVLLEGVFGGFEPPS